MRLQFPLLLVFILFFSCQNEIDTSQDNQPLTDVVSPTLLCEDISQDADITPRQDVYFLANEMKVKIANLSICDTILTENYATINIPSTALIAVGGHWAGAADYIYLDKKGEVITIQQQSIFEEDSTFFQPTKLAVFENGAVKMMQGNEKNAQLVGTYTFGTHDEAYIALVAMDGMEVKLKMYEIEGMLPPSSEIFNYLEDFKEVNFSHFKINKNYTFSSDWGAGKFSNDGQNLEFLEKKEIVNGHLTLKKIEE